MCGVSSTVRQLSCYSIVTDRELDLLFVNERVDLVLRSKFYIYDGLKRTSDELSSKLRSLATLEMKSCTAAAGMLPHPYAFTVIEGESETYDHVRREALELLEELFFLRACILHVLTGIERPRDSLRGGVPEVLLPEEKVLPRKVAHD